jgi:hypothetical protein
MPKTKQIVILINGNFNTFIIIKVLKIKFLQNYFSFFEQVFIPRGTYNGQKLTKLVRTNTIAKPRSTIPNVPEIMFIKYKTPKIAAKANLISLSALPIFFFTFTSF